MNMRDTNGLYPPFKLKICKWKQEMREKDTLEAGYKTTIIPRLLATAIE